MDKRLEGKVAIVTGAGQTPGDTIGNGRAISILFARAGAKVALADVRLDSAQGRGTTVNVTFGHSHIDRQPLGDIGLTIISLIAGSPRVDFVYTHRKEGREYRLDTRSIRGELGDVPIEHVEVLLLIRDDIEQGARDLGATA